MLLTVQAGALVAEAHARHLRRFAERIKAAIEADSLTISVVEARALLVDGRIVPRQHLLVEATWPGGSFRREYAPATLYRLCRTRRGLLKDIMEARWR